VFAVKATLCSVVVWTALLSSGLAGETNHLLFIIERSKNANIVRYDANLTADGKLDAKQPVTGYWLLLAKDGKRAEFNMVERVKGYGFDIKPDPSGKAWVMTLAAYPKREITVRPTDKAARAEIVIAGRVSVLEKLYIKSTEGLVLPTVNYIELFGKDLETGEKKYEKLLP
jgi:hypothetical protein